MGRWLNHDPYKEPGFQANRNRKAGPASYLSVFSESGNPNLFAFLRNAGLNDIDPFGLYNTCPPCPCGDDVTILVYEGLSKIALKFSQASWHDQQAALYNMLFPPNPQVFDSWDMSWLEGYASPFPPCGNCSHTVTFERTCVSRDELNYMMFGLGITLSGMDPAISLSELLDGLTARHPTEGLVNRRKVAAADYGYAVTSGSSSTVTPMNFRWPGDCLPSTTRGHTAHLDNWKWTPIQ